MRAISVLVGTFGVVLVSACGGASSAGSSSNPSAGDVVQYQQLSLQTQAAVDAYGQTMTGTMVSTLAECQSVEDRYDGQVRPWISLMVQGSAAMDNLVATHGGSGEADVDCDANAMMQELDRHHSAACASSDLATDRAEAARHVQAMTGYTGHATERCDEMLSGLGGDGWSWSPMMSGCQSAGMHGGMRGNH